MADGCSTIRAVTQASHPGCPRSPGTLSAISLEWVSAISGMRTRNILLGGLAATASLAAQAQSSVTLYGLIDIAPAMVSRTNTADDRLFRLNSDTGSSSRFGVRGTEDLGGGLAAFFNLEAPLDAKNGSVPGGAASGACNAAAGCASATTPAFWRRNAYVGLRGGFGEVTFGRNYGVAACTSDRRGSIAPDNRHPDTRFRSAPSQLPR